MRILCHASLCCIRPLISVAARVVQEYSYMKCPRSRIFRRDAPTKVNTYADMRWMMRYNDFQDDP